VKSYDPGDVEHAQHPTLAEFLPVQLAETRAIDDESDELDGGGAKRRPLQDEFVQLLCACTGGYSPAGANQTLATIDTLVWHEPERVIRKWCGLSMRQVEVMAHARATVILCFQTVRARCEASEEDGGEGVLGALGKWERPFRHPSETCVRSAFEHYNAAGRDTWAVILSFAF